MNGSRRRLALGLGAVAAAQGAAYLFYRQVTGEREAARDTSFSYETVQGPPISLEARLQHRDEREALLQTLVAAPVLVHFWATWCEPCRLELPELLALDRPAAILVSTDETWPVVEHFFDGRVPSNVMRDARSEARSAFRVTTLPNTFLLDAAGRPLARFHGARVWNSVSARRALDALLRRSTIDAP